MCVCVDAASVVFLVCSQAGQLRTTLTLGVSNVAMEVGAADGASRGSASPAAVPLTSAVVLAGGAAGAAGGGGGGGGRRE